MHLFQERTNCKIPTGHFPTITVRSKKRHRGLIWHNHRTAGNQSCDRSEPGGSPWTIRVRLENKSQSQKSRVGLLTLILISLYQPQFTCIKFVFYTRVSETELSSVFNKYAAFAIAGAVCHGLVAPASCCRCRPFADCDV
jgi:hypothetical protein